MATSSLFFFSHSHNLFHFGLRVRVLFICLFLRYWNTLILAGAHLVEEAGKGDPPPLGIYIYIYIYIRGKLVDYLLVHNPK
ncbi:hypothetical protein L211DRAFT_178948 [Terfezia boudieri ATCC MYA-4762]|uniref:Uncharacterized protein n=1 Tax=Terfezia boudieri ATCC MYA-4762 TaxID=1051890 RepID=A0A3N4LP41_9PEZI|nr:hypothetical protein L211DRAFT_178948 [Terfezia boudieri ATCC MYA-4762]